jgi:hypothetical protein
MPGVISRHPELCQPRTEPYGRAHHVGFTRADVSFSGARFSDGEVDFRGTSFSGGQVDFAGATDWPHPPRFDWEGTPPAGLTLPASLGGEAQ